MEIPEQLIRETLAKYFESKFDKLLPEILKEILSKNIAVQDCIPIAQAMGQYDLSRQTIYNYHNRGTIQLYSSGGKTYVSIKELEAHIKGNRLQRHRRP